MRLLQDKERGARPEELVRMYDTLLANAGELNELAAEVGGARGEALMDDCAAKVRRLWGRESMFWRID